MGDEKNKPQQQGGFEKRGGYTGQIVETPRRDGLGGKIEEGLGGGPSASLLPPDVIPARPQPTSSATPVQPTSKDTTKGSK